MIKVRVYQRDSTDEIRIGRPYYIVNKEKAVEDVKKSYEERFLVPFEEFPGKYDYTVAIVDADDLSLVATVCGEF